MYAEGIKGANQFYNAGNFAASANFGEAAFAEAAGANAVTTIAAAKTKASFLEKLLIFYLPP